jgi:hypothetical protein
MRAAERPVRVYYFPKGRRGRTRSSVDLPGATTASGVTATPSTGSGRVGVWTDSGEDTVTEPGVIVSTPTRETRSDYTADEQTKVGNDPRLNDTGRKGKLILGGAAARPAEVPAHAPKPRPKVDLGLGNIAQAQKIEQLIVARDPIAALQGLSRSEMSELALVGHKLFERGKIAQARAIFEALVAVGMTEAFPYTMLGTVYLAQGNPSRALALFEAALRIDGKDLAARVYRGEIRAQSGKHPEALADFADVIRQGRKDDPFVQRARQLTRITTELAKKRR